MTTAPAPRVKAPIPILADRTLATVVGVISSLYLVSGSYTGLNGYHVWRQADAFAQVLGYLGFKGMHPLQVFNGDIALYDMPIYEFVSAALSRVLNTDPVVAARLVNLLAWGVFLVAGFLLAEWLLRGAGLWFVVLASASPLYLQFFVAPIPDGLSVALATAATSLLLRRDSWGGSLVAALLFVVSALIKSPIPFVFIVFLIAVRFTWSGRFGERRGLVAVSRFAVPLGAGAVAAVTAEAIRKAVVGSGVDGFAQDPSWYFGTLAMRRDPIFWQTIWNRIGEVFPFTWFALLFVAVLVVSCLLRPHRIVPLYLPLVVGFFAGWLVFANVFFIHDYYEMAVTVLLLLLAACVVAELPASVRAIASRNGLRRA